MSKKLSDKDKEDWENFISNKEKIPNKDFVFSKKIRKEKIKKIDLHGYTLEECKSIYRRILYKNVLMKMLLKLL